MGAAVIDALRDEHRRMERLLAALERQVVVFARGERPDYDVIAGVADYFLDYPDRCHHPKDDALLKQLQREHPEAAAELGALAGEHQALHELAQRFRDCVTEVLGESDIARSTVVEAAAQFVEA